MKPFRIADIHLDEDHDVSGITAVIDSPYLAALETHAAGPVRVLRRERGDTELWVDLFVVELLNVFRAVGSLLDSAPLQSPAPTTP